MKYKVTGILLQVSLFMLPGCGEAVTENNDTKSMQLLQSEEYVNLNCAAGDIAMTLYSDQTFDMTILVWDDSGEQHKGQENVKGKWAKEEKSLRLSTTSNKEIIYNLATTVLKINEKEFDVSVYMFSSASKDFFGTGFDLIERGQMDSVLHDVESHK